MPEILGKQIGLAGYGLLGLTWRSEPLSEEDSFKAMRAALANGSNFWNAGEFYGTPDFNSLTLLEKYFTKYPEDADEVLLSVKGGLKDWQPDGSPENVRSSVDNCLKLLNGKKKIDMFKCARVDKNIPIETTLKVLDEEYVKTGKIGGIGLSEVSADTIERAVKVCNIVAVEVEVSLWATDIFSNGVAQACARHNLPIVAYAPIGRGMLTGQITKPEDIPEGDFRKTVPRFQKEHFGKNLELVRELEKIAKRLGCTPAQLAISWVRSLSGKGWNPEIIPIPGSATVDRVNENAKYVPLNEEDLAEIDSILQSFEVAGDRYGGHAAEFMDG
ncbi:hypothetical protein V500_02788 [Pseudogymnoascus sp. VKM F-4518 (FW-2643)]|nr:hypothetical protein V500_02788 [Pseudogymnoascus sp. VKM F-4518 (FW-2643)]